jgi:indolepyruvate decarboxylase
MNLTEYLFHRIRELGVGHTFGIPGDFVLPVYAVQEQLGMPTVVCAHEPGVGFAADAYARIKGLGVALVTYGPGALNTLNPVACAYAEQSPLLVVSGGPEVAMRRPELHLHHVVKTFESQLQIYREVTVDAAILDDPETAPELIDRVLLQVVRHKRPGYLEIPRDRVLSLVASPAGPLLVELSLPQREAMAGALDELTGEIVAMLAAAQRPVLYVGAGVRRHDLTAAVVQLAERLGVPVATDLLGKSAFPESHPQFAGLYLGALGTPEMRDLLDHSDCVLSIGVMATDLGTGFWTQKIDARARVMIEPDGVQVRYHRYANLPIATVVAALNDRLAGDHPFLSETASRMARFVASIKDANDRSSSIGANSAKSPLTSEKAAAIGVGQVIEVLRELDQSLYSFTADVGDSWFIGLEIRADLFLAGGYYASMGFGVPAALGAGIAEPARRPFAIVGDGAFQMTGVELSTHVDCGLRSIILLLNNSGYGMLEAIDGPHSYYERRTWDYVAMAQALGADAERVSSAADLRAALKRADAAPKAYLIEVITARDDISPVMARIRNHLRTVMHQPAAL